MIDLTIVSAVVEVVDAAAVQLDEVRGALRQLEARALEGPFDPILSAEIDRYVALLDELEGPRVA